MRKMIVRAAEETRETLSEWKDKISQAKEGVAANKAEEQNKGEAVHER